MQASIALQEPQLDPLQNGYDKESDGQMKPIMTDALPKTIIEMVSCCRKTDCSFAGVHAEPKTYPAPIFVSEAVSVRMIRTHRASMTLIMTMKSTICKSWKTLRGKLTTHHY